MHNDIVDDLFPEDRKCNFINVCMFVVHNLTSVRVDASYGPEGLPSRLKIRHSNLLPLTFLHSVPVPLADSSNIRITWIENCNIAQ